MSSNDQRELAGQALVTLRARVDDHFRAARADQPASFACAAGCSRCCHARFGVFELEAASVSTALKELAVRDPELRARVRLQGQAQQGDPSHSHCALLVDERCTVYDARPIICRSHGLAIKSAPDAKVDHCPLNFTNEAPRTAGVLAVDRVNAALSVAASMHTRDTRRIALSALAAADEELESS